MMANHGQLRTRHQHILIGRNSRLDTIQAAVLNIKLRYLDSWNLNRIKIADHYKHKLRNMTTLSLPEHDKDKKHVFHLFVIRSSEREGLIARLTEKGISSSVHYPKPLPLLEAYSYKGHSYNDFPQALKITGEVLSLPMFPEITLTQLEKICKTVAES